jgi:uncharacterized membrane protein
VLAGVGVLLAERPDLLDRLRAEPGLLPGMMEEALRWTSPTTTVGGTAVRGVTVGGTDIAVDDVVAASAPADLGDHMKLAPAKSRPRHPAILEREAQRAANAQLRIADAITRYAGSMRFVYVHAVLFAVWMLFIESNPWPKLTLVVSLEAIFLSTFVMIGQNRQAAFQEAKADHDFNEQELELKTNTELTRAIHVLTTELHRRLIEESSQ